MGGALESPAEYAQRRANEQARQLQNVAMPPDAFAIELAIRRIAEAGDENVKAVLRAMREEAFEHERDRWADDPVRSFCRAMFGGMEIVGVIFAPIIGVLAPFAIAWECLGVYLEGQASEIHK